MPVVGEGTWMEVSCALHDASDGPLCSDGNIALLVKLLGYRPVSNTSSAMNPLQSPWSERKIRSPERKK